MFSIPAHSPNSRKKDGERKENTSEPRILNAPTRITMLKEKEREQQVKIEQKETQQEEEREVRGMLISKKILDEKERLCIRHMMIFLAQENIKNHPKTRHDYLNACRKALVIQSFLKPNYYHQS